MTERTPPNPTGWIVLRGNVETATVGPFATEAEARLWQTLDASTQGDPDGWSVWPLFDPGTATAFVQEASR